MFPIYEISSSTITDESITSSMSTSLVGSMIRRSSNTPQSSKFERKNQAAFISTNNSFKAPKSGILVMQWLRAAVHMYCLAFQQLERELEGCAMQDVPIIKKRAVMEYIQHMFHAWSIIGKCLDTVHWKLAYQPMGDTASKNTMEWFCKRPWITDHSFAKSALINTLNPDNYPRMRSEPNALSGELGG